MERARVNTQTERGDKRTSELTASSHAQLSERKVRAEPTAGRRQGHPAFSQTQMPRAVVRQTCSRAENSTCDDAAERRQTEPR